MPIDHQGREQKEGDQQASMEEFLGSSYHDSSKSKNEPQWPAITSPSSLSLFILVGLLVAQVAALVLLLW